MSESMARLTMTVPEGLGVGTRGGMDAESDQ